MNTPKVVMDKGFFINRFTSKELSKINVKEKPSKEFVELLTKECEKIFNKPMVKINE
jgi:hypothetical protein